MSVTVSSDGYPESHRKAHRLRWPTAYRTSVAEPSARLRLTVLRASCGRLIGVGYVWHRQGYIAWRRFGA